MNLGDPKTYTFTHLVNVTGVNLNTPMEIVPGFWLLRAPPEHAAVLRGWLAHAPIGLEPLPFRNAMFVSAYETRHVERQGHGGNVEELQVEQWNYFGLASLVDEQGASTLETLDLASCIFASPMFELGARTNCANGSMIVSPPPKAAPLPRAPSFSVGASDLDPFLRVYRSLVAHDHQQLDLRLALKELRELRRMEPGSRLRFLGYFSVLESLLAHQPDPTDKYESITRQVTRKMALLANRTGFAPQYHHYFPSLKAANVFKKLYSYRSSIAHGSGSGPEADLKSHEHALAFLIQAVTMVMRHALEEPVLIRDLREC